MLAERLVPVYYLLCLADICMLHCFFASMFQSRYNGWKLYLCIGSVSFCAFLENSFALSWLNLICLPIICFLYVLLQFRVSVRNGVIYTLIFLCFICGWGSYVFYLSSVSYGDFAFSRGILDNWYWNIFFAV